MCVWSIINHNEQALPQAGSWSVRCFHKLSTSWGRMKCFLKGLKWTLPVISSFWEPHSSVKCVFWWRRSLCSSWSQLWPSAEGRRTDDDAAWLVKYPLEICIVFRAGVSQESVNIHTQKSVTVLSNDSCGKYMEEKTHNKKESDLFMLCILVYVTLIPV